MAEMYYPEYTDINYGKWSLAKWWRSRRRDKEEEDASAGRENER